MSGLATINMESPVNLTDMLSHWSKLQPSKPAYKFHREDANSDEVSYLALERWAKAIGSELELRGLTGSRAILLYPPGLDFIVAFLGCLYAGVVAVPICPPRPRRSAPHLEAILANCAPSVVLSIEEMHQKGSRIFKSIDAIMALPWLHTESFRYSGSITGCRTTEVHHATLAFLQYTSGSTSSPKGVMVTHGNLLYNSDLIQKTFGTDEQTVAVSWLPHFHDMGLIGGILGPLYCGGTGVLISPAAFIKRPLFWLETISETKATISGGPDFSYAHCARKISPNDCKHINLSHWRLAFSGSEPVRQETIDRFVNTFASAGFRAEAFTTCYGLAEATLMVSSNQNQAPPISLEIDSTALRQNRIVLPRDEGGKNQAILGCGRQLPGQEIRIIDPDTYLECQQLCVGEIWVHGPSIAQGYWNSPKATEETFQARIQADDSNTTYLRTGDLGFFYKDELFITGRRKDLIIIRGRNFYPQDIEWTARQSHPLLQDSLAAAFSVEVNDQEELIVAIEFTLRNHDIDTELLFSALSQAIGAEHEIDVYAILLLKQGSIFRTSSGKIQRHACRSAYQRDDWSIVERWVHAPATTVSPITINTTFAPHRMVEEIRIWLVNNIAGLMSVPKQHIDIHAPFASLGLSSLQGVKLVEQLEKHLGHRVSPTWLYNHPSIMDLACFLAGKESVSETESRAALPSDEELWTEIEQLSEEELKTYVAKQMEDCSSLHGVENR